MPLCQATMTGLADMQEGETVTIEYATATSMATKFVMLQESLFLSCRLQQSITSLPYKLILASKLTNNFPWQYQPLFGALCLELNDCLKAMLLLLPVWSTQDPLENKTNKTNQNNKFSVQSLTKQLLTCLFDAEQVKLTFDRLDAFTYILLRAHDSNLDLTLKDTQRRQQRKQKILLMTIALCAEALTLTKHVTSVT